MKTIWLVRADLSGFAHEINGQHIVCAYNDPVKAWDKAIACNKSHDVCQRFLRGMKISVISPAELKRSNPLFFRHDPNYDPAGTKYDVVETFLQE